MKHTSGSILLLAGFLATRAAGLVSCATSQGDNVFQDPSFEDSDPNIWWNIWAGSVGTSTDEHTDGSQSLVVGGDESIIIFQSVSGLEVGQSYRVNFDYKAYYPPTSPPPATPQTCQVQLEFVYLQASTIVEKAFTYTAGDEPTWQSISSEFVATGESGNMEFVFNCEGQPNNDNNFFDNFRLYVDNAILEPIIETCTTATTSTTSSATFTTASTTTITTETFTTSSAAATTMTTVQGRCGPKYSTVVHH